MSTRKSPNAVPPGLQIWIDVRRRHHLSHAHVQLERELGMYPRKTDKIDDHEHESWKAPLPIFMESGSTRHQAGRWAETESGGTQFALRNAARGALLSSGVRWQ